MVKKREPNEHATIEEAILISTSENPEPTEDNREDLKYESLLASAQEFRKNEKVLGYILRGELQATVDLNEPARIIDYAMMASQVIESSEIMAESFNLGKVESVIIEGNAAKIVCAILGQNKISVFMEKTADANWLLDILLPKEAGSGT